MKLPGRAPVVDHEQVERAALAEAVRSLLQLRGAFGRCSSLSVAQIMRLIEHVHGDQLLAVEILAMRPWPTWLPEVLFPGRTSRP